MFCRNCGKTIPDDAMLCCYCGQDQYPPAPGQASTAPQPTPQPSPAPAPVPDRPTTPAPKPSANNSHVSLLTLPVLKTIRYNTAVKRGKVAGVVIFCVIGAAAIIAGLIFLAFSKTLIDYIMSAVVLVLGGDCVYIAIYNAGAIKAINLTELNITAQGIYGSGSDKKYRQPKSFELTYDRITNISTLPTHLVVDANDTTYYILMSDPSAAQRYIENLMKAYNES